MCPSPLCYPCCRAKCGGQHRGQHECPHLLSSAVPKGQPPHAASASHSDALPMGTLWQWGCSGDTVRITQMAAGLAVVPTACSPACEGRLNRGAVWRRVGLWWASHPSTGVSLVLSPLCPAVGAPRHCAQASTHSCTSAAPALHLSIAYRHGCILALCSSSTPHGSTSKHGCNLSIAPQLCIHTSVHSGTALHPGTPEM